MLTTGNWLPKTNGSYWLPTRTYPNPTPGETNPGDIMLTRGANKDLTGSWGASGQGAIIETQLSPLSFVSQIFLVEKRKGGGLKTSHKCLNNFVRKEHFKMEGLHLLPDLIQSVDWMVKLDLKDAYLQVPIHKEHQCLLQFQWHGKVCMSPIRPNISTQGVLENNEAGCGASETNGDSISGFPGQHTHNAPFRGGTHTTDFPRAPAI